MDRYYIIISAVLTAISYEYFGPGILISLIPLGFCIWKQSTLFSWGLIYMGICHAFFIELNAHTNYMVACLLWAVCTTYFASIYGIGGIILNQCAKKFRFNPWLGLPVTFTLIELIKQIGIYGNTNGNLGFALSNFVHWIQFYSIVGCIGISILIIIINVLSIEIIRKKRLAHSITIISILLIMFGIGSPTSLNENRLSVSVIQTNIDQQQKMTPRLWPSIEKTYTKALIAAPGKIIVFPESIIPTTIKNRNFYNEWGKIAKQKNQHILFGSFINESGLYNGSLLISPDESRHNSYKKRRLMPFGETLPLRSIFTNIIPSSFLFNDFKKGTENVIHHINGIMVQPLICLEGIYDVYFRESKASVIAILANNAWYNFSSAGSKLKKFAQVYAAQYQRPILLSANFGESAIISHTGKLMETANHHQSAILSSEIKINTSNSFYKRFPGIGIITIIMLWSVYIKGLIKQHR